MAATVTVSVSSFQLNDRKPEWPGRLGICAPRDTWWWDTGVGRSVGGNRTTAGLQQKGTPILAHRNRTQGQEHGGRVMLEDEKSRVDKHSAAILAVT
jgi:hypothetical protein